MSNILQHNIERFGMVTVMDVTLYDINSGAPLLFLDTLKMTNISVEGQNKEIRGGMGNDMLISYDFGRTATIEMQDALISPVSLSFLWGKKYAEAGDLEDVYYDRVETVTVVTNAFGSTLGALLDTSAIVTTSTIKAYAMSVDSVAAANSGEVSIVLEAGKKYVVNTTSPAGDVLKAGQTYKIFYQALEEDGTEIVLTNDDFPSAVKLVGTTFVIQESDGKKKRVQIEIPKFKINSNFSFTMDAEGDASVFDFNGVALANGGELIKFRYLGDY
jgi:hypothetical protein